MDGTSFQGKTIIQDYIVDEDIDNDMEEEDGGGVGGYVDNEKKKVFSGRRGSGGGSVSPPRCLVETCGADLTDAKRYHRRHKVCEVHSKAAAVIVAGLRQRFCQQCSRFHELTEFDEAKRSCRRRLAGHNERRRKTSAETIGEGTSRRGYGTTTTTTQLKDSHCRQIDEKGRVQVSLPGNTPYKRSQIR